jgi:hypothetical protein
MKLFAGLMRINYWKRKEGVGFVLPLPLLNAILSSFLFLLSQKTVMSERTQRSIVMSDEKEF